MTSPSRKRPANDENLGRPPKTPRTSFSHPLIPLQTTPSSNVDYAFVEGSTPVPSRRKVARAVDPLVVAEMRRERAERDAVEKQNRIREEALIRKQEAEAEQALRDSRVNMSLSGIKSIGFASFDDYMDAIFTTKDQQRSAQVTRYLQRRGPALLDTIHSRAPAIAVDWALSTTRRLIAAEFQSLVAFLKPSPRIAVCTMLERFSLENILSESEKLAPSTCQLLNLLSHSQDVSLETIDSSTRKNPKLVVASILCMLAKARNDHASEFQSVMGIYFLACSTSRSTFDVLNHAGISLSYTQTVQKLKQLGTEQTQETQDVAKKKALGILYDNLNFAFRVEEQRHNSKNRFDSGTTGTAVLLYGVEFGELRLDMKPPRKHGVLELDFTFEDLLPTLDEARRVEEAQIWHIVDIFLDAFPLLRKRLGSTVLPAPSVRKIPVHKTVQYPLPAMHIDESSLEGTLNVVNTIFKKSLKMTEEDIKKHGIIICAGDQLTLSLLDKCSALRRDDKTLMDNIGKYIEGQEGLLHVKFAQTRMLANEFWGKPNARAGWSLWKMNALLARKPVTVGWSAKKATPFRPTYELMLNLSLPANIIDGFRIYSPRKSSLAAWVDTVTSYEEIREVAKSVHRHLCSGRRVEKLRKEKPSNRDVVLENIILFNRDCILLRQLKYAIKTGDVGAVLDVIKHTMLAFRGTGKTPKYADALFSMCVRLRKMHPKLRDAWLNNWLANLSGRVDGFKEMDLLQEHQNFWLKIIYNTTGANRSWEWLSMVSVSIFALRDVIRQVQKEFRTPNNNTTHTTPSTDFDVKVLCEYLEQHAIQEFNPTRPGNDDAIPARDLIDVGASYANKPGAFRNFTYTTFDITNHGLPNGDTVTQQEGISTADDDEEGESIDKGVDIGATLEDLASEEDQYDEHSFAALASDVIEEFARYG